MHISSNILGRLGGKSVFRCTYLFQREWRFFRIWRESTALPQSFGDSFNTSRHADCCPRTQFFSRASRPGVFGIRSARPFTPTSVLKTEFFIPISSDEKGTTSDAKASANHLAPSPSSSSHATQWPTFLSPSTGLWSAGSLTLSWLSLAVSRCAG